MNQLSFSGDLEVSPAVLRFQLEQVVARVDVPLKLEKPIPLSLGRLRDGRVLGFEIEERAVRLELGFAGGLKIGVELSEVVFDAEMQVLRLTVARLTPTGFVGAALVNPLRSALLAGAARAANARVPNLLRVTGGSKLEVDLRAFLRRVLEDDSLRSALTRVLPVRADMELSISRLEVNALGVLIGVRGAARG